MFSFFKRKKTPEPAVEPVAAEADALQKGPEPSSAPDVLVDDSSAFPMSDTGVPEADPTPVAVEDEVAQTPVSVTPEVVAVSKVETPAPTPVEAEPSTVETALPVALSPVPAASSAPQPEPEPVSESVAEADAEIEAKLEPEPEFEAVVESLPEPEPEPEPTPPTAQVAPAPAAAPKKTSWLSRLTQGLSRTGQSISTLFVGAKVDEALYEELETALIMADAGMEATEKLLGALRAKVRKEKLTEATQVKAALRDLLAEHLAPLERAFPLDKPSPQVVMIAGVNGAGKTTSIGKLAHAFQAADKKVLLAAGDTFRAAAREQLVIWGQRNNVAVIAQDGGDPAAVAFDAVNAGRARGMDIIMVDTAGRLPTQLNLMEELKKIRRVVGKADPKAPHEVLLVVDGNTGQNALAQIRAFDAAINLTGLVVTKLDGTAKGGVLAAVAAGSQGVRPVPVYWIGVGESMDDLQPFVAREFAAALVGE